MNEITWINNGERRALTTRLHVDKRKALKFPQYDSRLDCTEEEWIESLESYKKMLETHSEYTNQEVGILRNVTDKWDGCLNTFNIGSYKNVEDLNEYYGNEYHIRIQVADDETVHESVIHEFELFYNLIYGIDIRLDLIYITSNDNRLFDNSVIKVDGYATLLSSFINHVSLELISTPISLYVKTENSKFTAVLTWDRFVKVYEQLISKKILKLSGLYLTYENDNPNIPNWNGYQNLDATIYTGSIESIIFRQATNNEIENYTELVCHSKENFKERYRTIKKYGIYAFNWS